MELFELGIEELGKALGEKKIKPSEVLDSVYKRIDAVDGRVKAHILAIREYAYARAKEEETRLMKGIDITPLTGIPIGIKDNIVLEGIQTTCAAKMLKGYKPPYTATALLKLIKAGVIFTGKLNMDEYALGSSTENSGFFDTKNPWDLSRVPGGSSGGSAAAVAADMCAASIGSDTGGSIKQPASLCGVTGLKPTYGRISRYGLIAFGSSLDQIGPVAKSVRDAAILTEYMSGFDVKDSTSADVAVEKYHKNINTDIKGKIIGLPKEYFIDGMQKEVRGSIDAAVKVFERLGAKTELISLPHTEYAIDVYYVVATAEVSSNLARFDGVQYGLRDAEAQNMIDMYKRSRQKGFGKETKRRIMLGTYVLSSGYYDAYYKKAQKVRTLIKNDFEEAFKKVDVILTPTCPTTAFKSGEKTADPLTMYLSDIFTIAPNLAGLPGISVPCGFDGAGLPIGMQLLGKPFAEQELFNTAGAYQENTDFHKKKAKL